MDKKRCGERLTGYQIEAGKQYYIRYKASSSNSGIFTLDRIDSINIWFTNIKTGIQKSFDINEIYAYENKMKN